jgi:hydroxymethylpyrimidine/phosphomethylpyrimidine kinase
LLAADAVAAVRSAVVPRALVVTPNAPEAERLTGLSIATAEDQRAAGAALRAMGAQAALIKGGHLEGDEITDVLSTAAGDIAFTGARIATRATHGTGCTLASAIAVHLAQGRALEDAVRLAREYLLGAIINAPGFGAGHGPLGHAWTLKPSRDG